MTSLMQHMLGADWDKLPPALQAHYRGGTTIESGHMDIAYPRYMQPVLYVLAMLGALVKRGGRDIATVVHKQVIGERLYWQRTLRYPDGSVARFNSVWTLTGNGQLIEFVNPVLGLQMAPFVSGAQLHYRGVRFVARLGPLLLPIPEWLALGHTTIVEEAVDDSHFVMDFRLTHPLFGEVFRYAGKFATGTSESC